MKKPFNFRDLSDVQCTHPGCKKHIKKNVLARKPKADLCYKHYEEGRKEFDTKLKSYLKKQSNEKVNYRNQVLDPWDRKQH